MMRSFSLYATISDDENPFKIEHNGSRDIAILVMLKAIKYKKNGKVLLSVSKNQYYQVPTHFA